jgi:N utilization substance protein B
LRSLQALYEIDIAGHPLGIVLEERIVDAELDANLSEFARQIVMGVHPLAGQLDHFIAQHAPEWPLDQIAIIDRNILRIALWESVSDQTKFAINRPRAEQNLWFRQHPAFRQRCAGQPGGKAGRNSTGI